MKIPPTKENPTFWLYLWQKGLSGWFSGCEYSKVEGVLKLQRAREYSGKNHRVLALC